jgi:hypothetical protein
MSWLDDPRGGKLFLVFVIAIAFLCTLGVLLWGLAYH